MFIKIHQRNKLFNYNNFYDFSGREVTFCAFLDFMCLRTHLHTQTHAKSPNNNDIFWPKGNRQATIDFDKIEMA